MADYIIFGGVDSRTFGLYAFPTDDIYNAAEREYEQIQVPGKNGDLLLDRGRFKNTNVSYQFALPDSFKSQAEAFRNALLAVSGYAQLRDTFHPDQFRVAAYTGPFKIMSADRAGEIGALSVTFYAKPQRFLDSGEAEQSAGTIENPTLFDAQPLITIPAQSDTFSGEIGVGTQTITITGAPASTKMMIDCELMECYGENGENLNSYVSVTGPDFPVLPPGESTFSSDIPGTTIKGRWWIV